MNARLKLGLFGLAIAAVSATVGYIGGFQQAWRLSLMAEAAPRGAVAAAQLKTMESGRTDFVRLQLESNIDTALIGWWELERSPAFPALNVLTLSSVHPDYERLVRRVARYRAANPSPILASEAESAAEAAIAAAKLRGELSEDMHSQRQVVDSMVARFGR